MNQLKPNDINVFDVVNYLICRLDTSLYGLTNYKMNQLLYYIQGHYIAKYDQPLFPEALEATIFGPIVPIVFGTFFEFALKFIPNDYFCQEARKQPLSDEAKTIIQKVIDEYARLGVYDLRVRIWQEYVVPFS
ncbi:Panacea domain-containing protein [Candidatus Phytoplasma pini]|uniref:Phage-Associated Protein n=1 Tax=Candidatus Phytoplasma pini TaxID=267362 RepID=A0A559KJ00_9MOLU|nr:type II toxin-antitoxin system antitoxin SocA domain-containing protein [Candidatus Phytoplasma pini]TVY12114.1 Phage-Associated Protein [Candidatus Phytoplasma pini]